MPSAMKGANIMKGANMMKTITMITMMAIFMILTTAAYGATIVYQPEEMSMMAKPGEVVPVDFEIAFDTRGRNTLYVTGLEVVGDIPAHWVNLKMPVMVISDRQVRIAAEVAISEFASPGTYQAIIMVTGERSRMPVDTGKGVAIKLEIKKTCQEAPTFNNITIGPDAIKAQRGKTVNIEIQGMVTVADGCHLSKAGYSLKDEYGQLDNNGKLELDSMGNFSIALPVKASRLGQDKDGRTYTVTLFATNEAGRSKSGNFEISVKHDQGKGKKK